MNPILTIARFELFYQLRQPSFYLFAVLVFGQGIWYSVLLSASYPYDDSATTTYLILSSLGVIMAMVAVLLAGQSLTKDIEYRTAPYLFTLPITSRMHVAGRFMGTYATALLLALFYPLGVAVYSMIFSPGNAISWLAMADSFIRLVAQNVFIVVSVTFSLTVFLRSTRGAYIGLFLVVLYFLLTESSGILVTDSDLWKLLDPFGVGMARESIHSTPFMDDPNGLLVFSDMFLINRLLWLGIPMGLLAYAENTFTFAYFTARKPVRVRQPSKRENTSATSLTRPNLQPQFGGWVSGLTVWRLTKLEFGNLVRQPIFGIIVGLLVLLFVLLSTVLGQNPDFPELPITSRMTALRLPMGFLISLFLLVMTVELFFHERTVGFWSIYDALPQPNVVLLSGKLLALIGVGALLTGVLFLTGMGVQLASGFYDIDLPRYADDLLTDGFLRYCQLIALSALVAALVNHRLTSHVINVLLFSCLVLIYQLPATESFVYLYSFLPGSLNYSDLTGYGAAANLRLPVHFLWWSVAGIFITALLLTWSRGVPGSLSERTSQWQTRFDWRYRLVFMVLGVGAGLTFWQTQQRLAAAPATPAIRYATQTKLVPSVSGKAIRVQIRHHHPYQIQHIMRAVRAALNRGEQLFGAYPYDSLRLAEVPVNASGADSKPGVILLSEKQGWTADNRQPNQLDYIDYVVSREVYRQWLVHRLHPAPGDGFVRQSLAEYLALQGVEQRYGIERLKKRLAERANWYARSRQPTNKTEPSILQSTGNDAIERGRAALVLTSIGEVWGTKPLSLTIGQFYKKAIQQPTAGTATAFANQLTHDLPDSLHYLPTYLSEPLWFDFKIGRVASLPNGLTVEILATKWRESKKGHRNPLPINDYVPLVVLNQAGEPIYRQVVHPNPDERYVSLPALPNARSVLIDPLGAWPEPNKRDNAKLF